jgi:hypothetical protein
MIKVTEAEAVGVWKSTAEPKNADIICREYNLNIRVVERLRRVERGFLAGDSDEEIAKYIKQWNAKSIKLLHKWWLEYKVPIDPVTQKKYPIAQSDIIKHRNSLSQVAAQIRQRIINPEIAKRDYGSTSSWQWAGQDWRVSPSAWFAVMAQCLDNEKLLDEDFPLFKEHMGGSSFFSDYNQLKKGVFVLQNEIGKATNTLLDDNPDLCKTIKFVQDYLADFAIEDAWDPDDKPSPENIKPLQLNPTVYDTIIKELSDHIPDYKNRLVNLENLLQVVWDDLSPTKIDTQLQNSTCSLGY